MSAATDPSVRDFASPAPRLALLLGYAGLLPPLGLCLAVALLPRFGPAGVGGLMAYACWVIELVYAMLIFSFLGGTWWGIAAARSGEGAQAAPAWLYALGVLPALLAMGLLPFSGAAPFAVSTGAGLLIAATALVDARLASEGLVPPWWRRLRRHLSLGLALLTIATGALIAGVMPAAAPVTLGPR